MSTKNSSRNIVSSKIQKLELIDFADLSKVLDWICEFQVTSRCLRVSDENKTEILSIFQRNGINSDLTFGSDCNSLSAKDFGVWICGQALFGIVSDGYPSQEIHGFIKLWKFKFALYV